MSVTECFGGLLLILGLGSRFITLIFVFEMIVAYVTSEQEALHAFFSDPDKFVAASPFLFLYAALIVFIFGPGRISIDALIFKDKGASSPRIRGVAGADDPGSQPLSFALGGPGRRGRRGGPAIVRHPWSNEVWAQAKREHKLVLLDLEAVWCHWCHVMDATTYRDPAVAALIREHYLAVKVDQDSRPDLANRYEDYGWPATVIYNPDGGEIIKKQGYIAPAGMARLLRAVVADPSPVDYRDGAAGAAAAERHRPPARAPRRAAPPMAGRL